MANSIGLRAILPPLGQLLLIVSGFMLLCSVVDYMYGEKEWQAFLISSFITAFFGGGFYFSNRASLPGLTIRQGFVFTTASWVVLPLFCSIPFYLSPTLHMSFVDSFFESMSGLASCGATVISGLDTAPEGILLWRAMLNWLGGIGIIVVAIAILPALKVGGMQLFKMESSDKSEKIMPTARQISTGTVGIYVFMTAICVLLLWLSGMTVFDAICYAMAALATGGFSTKDASLGYYNNLPAELTLVTFMILSALPYVLFIQAAQGGFKPILRDKQVRVFLALLAFFVLSTALWLMYADERYFSFPQALRLALFNVTSIMTTCGLFSDNVAAWGSYGVFVILLVSIIGGCTGSTAGGIKIFRLIIVWESIKEQVLKLVHPHRAYRPQFGAKTVDETIVSSVVLFSFVYVFSLLLIALIISWSGLDFITSLSATASSLAAAGYGLGTVINSTYEPLSDFVKWTLCFAMLLGRLEFFTVLVLFVPSFWRS